MIFLLMVLLFLKQSFDNIEVIIAILGITNVIVDQAI